MKLSEKVVLPRTRADVDAMSAAEIESAIAELRRLQNKSRPARVRRSSVWGDAFGNGFAGCRARPIPSIQEAWAQDARNLRGDFERVGRDMWIGWLQNARSQKQG